MMNDNLASTFSTIRNAEKIGKKHCIVNKSKLIFKVLELMKQNGYLNDVKETEDKRHLEVLLNGKINDCGVIKPRFSVKKDEFKKWELRYLPAHGFGFIIVSTPKGIMRQDDARKQEIGGRLMAYVY